MFMTESRYLRVFAALAICTMFAAFTNAAPQPAELEERQLDSIFSDATAGAASVFSQVTDGAVSVFGDATSIAPGVFETVTSFGGSVFTVVTSQGGDVITLATSGAGVVTSFAGQKWTAATSAVDAAVTSGDNNGVAGLKAFGVMPGVASVMTVLCSAVFGAIWTLL
ncbi:hypothetical protein K435DRAFT_802375 [Dendrothele bispora CBS 962.96]|uniref:Uncharacterized protein n=1 Tax=Dendrothele bispora (strain CBS 962.96) TaxID=1314807 RepID=A0A4S8LMG5_DENBC|nr:hypothetical protein K435DRAFT_802375 [Dendrothele bispora CBS 962.96]